MRRSINGRDLIQNSKDYYRQELKRWLPRKMASSASQNQTLCQSALNATVAEIPSDMILGKKYQKPWQLEQYTCPNYS